MIVETARLASAERASAFEATIEPTAIDKMLVALAPRDVVTTNYDFQLERAFEQLAPNGWRAFVRHGESRPGDDRATWIHKMHGSFQPGCGVAQKYVFGEAFPFDSADTSIVITENDYDACYQEIGRADVDRAALMKALSRSCLIIGKTLDAQDLSFMYALRKTRTARRRAGHHAYMLFNGTITLAERLHLHNLEIDPLVVNLPRASTSGHFYFGLVAALARLFPDLQALFGEASRDPIANFAHLVRGPDAIAVGLASRNITGRTTYQGDSTIPTAGRRNLRYGDVEEHAGGSAMTPLMILAALNTQAEKHRLSMVSSIGRPAEATADALLKDATRLDIDADAVSRNQEATWYSTVLVHTSKIHDGSPYPGQRILLDRGYNAPVTLDASEADQLRAQLTQPNLRLLYLDKFLAAQHPPLKLGEAVDEAKLGAMLQHDNMEALARAIESRPEIDVVYETGGGGSPLQHVEQRLSRFVNVFTSGFPFFASVLLQNLNWALPSTLKVFNSNDPNSKWWEADFEKVTAAIETTLRKLLDPSKPTLAGGRIRPFAPSDSLICEAGKWAGRSSLSGGAKWCWYITTLHHYGALGIDIEHRTGWYCRTPEIAASEIQNTSGAGDSFRGALLYALLSAKDRGPEALPRALLFATDVATERCRHFKIVEACTAIATKFGGRYLVDGRERSTKNWPNSAENWIKMVLQERIELSTSPLPR